MGCQSARPAWCCAVLRRGAATETAIPQAFTAGYLRLPAETAQRHSQPCEVACAQRDDCDGGESGNLQKCMQYTEGEGSKASVRVCVCMEGVNGHAHRRYGKTDTGGI